MAEQDCLASGVSGGRRRSASWKRREVRRSESTTCCAHEGTAKGAEVHEEAAVGGEVGNPGNQAEPALQYSALHSTPTTSVTVGLAGTHESRYSQSPPTPAGELPGLLGWYSPSCFNSHWGGNEQNHKQTICWWTGRRGDFITQKHSNLASNWSLGSILKQTEQDAAGMCGGKLISPSSVHLNLQEPLHYTCLLTCLSKHSSWYRECASK